jgi:DMSO/TMAO reductase YedYZ molybdopterin-dependent catalytic subunit
MNSIYFALPPGQQLVAANKWPLVGESAPAPWDGPWHVDVAGLVARPCRVTVEQLLEEPQTEIVVDIHCVTRWSKPRVRFSGVLLAELVRRADVTSAACYASFMAHSARQHSTSLPLTAALDAGALVALQVEGRPLPIEHGGPVRLIVPGKYFYKSLKWLRRIELLAEDRLGYWEAHAGYHNDADPWLEQRFIAPGLTKQQAAAILGGRDVSGRDVLGLDAAGRDLAGLKAAQAVLRNASFCGCNLVGADFSSANLSNARFDDAVLQGASFCGADLEGASFVDADLRGADFCGAMLTAATFIETLADSHTSGGGAIIDESTRFDANAVDQLMPRQQEFLHGKTQGKASR